MRKRPIPCEHAVYGSFPFWNRGYAVLARSTNCRAEWLAALKSACQRFGERPRDCADARGFFAIPLPDGHCMVVGVFPNGRDDQGRPGALVFHAIFVPPRAYRKAGYDPFLFADGLRGDWSAGDVDTMLAPVAIAPGSGVTTEAIDGDVISEIARAIIGRKRVVVPSAAPIDLLARSVWEVLPSRTRMRASVATFAYDNSNTFDLVALPGQRSVGLARARDPACVVIDHREPIVPNETPPAPAMRPRLLGRIFRSLVPMVVSIGLLGCSSGKEVTPEAIAQARAAWEKAGIKDYEIELKIASPTGHYRSTVREGKVIKVESIQPDGRILEVHPGDTRFYSVEGQFMNMAEELAITGSAEPFGQPRGTKVVMRFGPDDRLGYPHWYRRDVYGANRGAAIDVVRFEPKSGVGNRE